MSNTTTTIAWTRLLVFMRLKLMIDIGRREGGDMGGIAPAGFKCSLPTPPAMGWADQHRYEKALRLPPARPTPLEQQIMDETVLWLTGLSPTDRMIIWCAASEMSYRSIAKQLAINGNIGCEPYSHMGVRKRWIRLLDDMASHWTACRRGVDPLTEHAAEAYGMRQLAELDMKSAAPRRSSAPRTAGTPLVNGEAVPLRKVTAAAIDAEALRRDDPLWDRQAWLRDYHADPVVPKKIKNPVYKVSK